MDSPGGWNSEFILGQEKELSTPAPGECSSCRHLVIGAQGVIDAMTASTCIVDADGVILYVNKAWLEFGRCNGRASAHEDIGRDYISLLTPGGPSDDHSVSTLCKGIRQVLDGTRDGYSYIYPCHAPNARRWFEMSVNPLRSSVRGQPVAAVIIHTDITELHLAQYRLQRISGHSTKASRRRLDLEDALMQRHSSVGWEPGAVLVLFDIQAMRDINDALGYARGDAVLDKIEQQVAEFTEGLSARIAGDEFLAYLPPGEKLSVTERINGLIDCVNRPCSFEDIVVPIEARFGYAVLEERWEPFDELMRRAEVALYHGARDSVTRYSSEIDRAYHHRLRVMRELQVAINRGQFELHYQPKVNILDGRLVSAEALIRWHHPERGLVPPAEFIPIAEQSQLIVPMGNWVLTEAVRTLRSWQDAGLDIVRIAVNISMNQLVQGDFCLHVKDTLEEYSIPPDALSLEVTESVFSEDKALIGEQLSRIRKLGVHLSLDDFGTGYSSLAYLKRFSFDEVKIDRTFVADVLSEDDYNIGIIKAVIAIADALGMAVVAEGVESQEVADRLVELGCYTAQGYYYSMPLVEEDFRWLLETCSHLPLGKDD